MFKVILLLSIFLSSIDAHDLEKIKICVDPDWMPIESIDKNGKHIGIVADILKLIEKKTILRFTLVPTKTWAESVKFIEEHKCDILPLASENEDRKKFMSFTSIYLNYPEAILIRSNEKMKTLEEFGKLSLGLTKGYLAAKWFKENYPDINIVEVENMQDAFAKLRSKEIYGYSDTLPNIGYALKKEGALDLEISEVFNMVNYSLDGAIGVRKDKPKLLKQMQSAIDGLSKHDLDHILSTWVPIDTKHTIIDYEFIYNALIGVLIGAFIVIMVILYWNRILKKSVNKKTNDIAIKNKNLEDSISYAKIIQHSLLPLNKDIKKYFKDFFNTWEPAYTVGGDLYTYEENKLGIYVGVLGFSEDGVPGALMTMLGGGMIQRIIHQQQIIHPAGILKELNNVIKTRLKQNKMDDHTLSHDDELDMGLCFINKKQNILKFSGVKIDLIYFDNNGESHVVAGDKENSDYGESEKDFILKTTDIQLTEINSLYITTGGLLSQIGGKNGLPYGKERFLTFLESIQEENFSQHKELIMKELVSYQGENDREDDVTIIGIKI